MFKKLIYLFLLTIFSINSFGQRIYGAALSRVPATDTLKTTAFNYATSLTLKTDQAAAQSLPNSLKFTIIQKSNNSVIKTFEATKNVLNAITWTR